MTSLEGMSSVTKMQTDDIPPRDVICVYIAEGCHPYQIADG